ncbi:putative E3 ubiquitin-protein ligase HERC2-like [Tropilaelaps mercedesae]|uniref:Putative E3 ubiquitin-protein ligase HERC2-like n=1 Tax=Tropilaelaps mercedesae TaxID=418985 RepID=A0A1V9XV63_9ACAR|nr:putative E3 ubiquitin-protein ligase HERC2-like [Tropilaelaps mercedesae]
MWRLTRFPVAIESGHIVADEVFLGWRQALVYRDCVLSDFASGKEIIKGPVDGCSLSRDHCAILQQGRCQVVGLYDDSMVEIPVSGIEQVSMLEGERVALRTHAEVVIYDVKARSVAQSWPIRACQISAGFDHLLALTTEGAVYAWGDGSRGQQGSGELASSLDLIPVEALEDVAIAQIASGGWHSTVLSRRGLVYQWGWNQHGQVSGPMKGSQRSCRSTRSTENHTVIVSPTLREVTCRRVIAVACGSRHSVSLDECGNVEVWGWNEYGQCEFNNTSLPHKGTRHVRAVVGSKVLPPTETGDRDYASTEDEKAQQDPMKCATTSVDRRSIGVISSRRGQRVAAAFWTTAVQYRDDESTDVHPLPIK